MASIPEITAFLKKVFTDHQKTKAVIAVSGGIDSALSTTLLVQALGKDNVFPLFLPYRDQSIADSETLATWNHIPKQNWMTINIGPTVDLLAKTVDARDLRKGNIMARVRMILVFDTAKRLDALVCGTENKSEHYLGYFTRFGDAASDIEPISHLYKTEVRILARELGLPQVFLDKAPSAGLWEGQTDEQEMGFSYEEADSALAVLLGESDEKVDTKTLGKVQKVMDKQAFKLQVPYVVDSDS